ncbi:very short patch repair endonuclease [Ferrovibrio xuzhouensis]|uniref:Very short patch repair endonuclease n=1 Tax=Ferrovibrio xuzhouensis TaxID=1576914 RepID=A0ABV7VLM7_9PROT
MSPEVRSAVMSKIRSKDTGPERRIAELLSALGYRWESHAKDLPGRPDLVFMAQRVAVFVDGDFWHGWRFSQWRDKLSEAWEAKIEANRRRDIRNRRRLRRMGWRVVRLWEHQIERDCDKCIAKILSAIEGA